MADTQISLLGAMSALAGGDLTAFVDVSDTTMSPSGTDKKVTAAQLATFIAGTLTIAESQVTNLVSDLAAKATDSLVVHLAGTETITGTKTFSATIGGSISGNAATATLATTAGSLSGSIAEGQVTGLVADLAAKAPLASPALTGAPTAPTASLGTNTTQIATTAFVLANAGGGGGGSGTVTTVSVATANGVSGSVANPTTTPAITITLGAITPTSVNGVAISGSSTPTLAVTGTTTVSGSNTGDQDLTSITTRLTNLEAITEVSVTSGTTLTSSAWGKYHKLGGSTAFTVGLPTAVGFDGKTIGFRNASTKAITLDGNASETIGGAPTRIMAPGETCLLKSDNANLDKIDGKSRPMACKLGLVTAQTMTWGADNQIAFDSAIVDNTSLMADLSNHQIVARRPGTYACTLSGFAGNSDLVDGNRVLGIIRSNGTQVTLSELSAGAGGSNLALVSNTGLITLAVGDAITASLLYVGATGSASQMDPVLEVREFDPW